MREGKQNSHRQATSCRRGGGTRDPCQCPDCWRISSIPSPAAGSRNTGSTQDHDALYSLLPVASHSLPGRRDQRHITTLVTRQPTDPFSRATITHPASQEERGMHQVVGTAPAVVESNWDVIDHDYTKGHSTEEDLSARLTPDEEDLITQLTSALEKVPDPAINQISHSNISLSCEEVKEIKEVGTPDILKDFLDFDLTAKPPNTGNMNGSDNVAPSESYCGLDLHSGSQRSSPVTKEQILVFLQDNFTSASPGSLASSESGYESSLSPRSLRSPDLVDPTMDFDMDSFNELFPTLF